MSIEVLTTMISFAGLLLALGSGFAWSVKRTDAQIQALRDEMRTGNQALRDEMHTGDQALRDEMRSEVGSLRNDVAAVREELIEVKLAIARLEGPTPRLITAR